MTTTWWWGGGGRLGASAVVCGIGSSGSSTVSMSSTRYVRAARSIARARCHKKRSAGPASRQDRPKLAPTPSGLPPPRIGARVRMWGATAGSEVPVAVAVATRGGLLLLRLLGDESLGREHEARDAGGVLQS